ncbi:putative ribonuclease H-like domain-containing protein [Tanacetum coccineum]|uniref:Ribonuclease H-like domain-containing protein n=1 Tax=Tanacetum coccineum TaxID=301880 RepID=A0ABQ5ERM3_9ASTR
MKYNTNLLNANALRMKDEAEELIVVPTAVRHTAAKGISVKFSNAGQVISGYASDDILRKPTIRAFSNRDYNNIHPQSQILGDPKSSVQTRSKVQQHSGAHALVKAMQEELLQFRLQWVWILVDLPHEANVIGTKCVYRNKMDERGVVVRNKARLVAQGHSRKRDKKDIMLVQVYVDDIIFGSTRKSWCDEFEALMKGKFQMDLEGGTHYSSLGLQVKQKTDGIFISKDNIEARNQASDEELEELMKDQPLSADASPTALSPGYIADSNPEEDKEDPADHPADG